MMNQTDVQTLQQRDKQLRKAVIALVLIVAAQVVVLEVVLRGWQGREVVTVFVGIVISALLCAIAITIFLYTRKKNPKQIK